jgi:hypothetical protein
MGLSCELHSPTALTLRQSWVGLRATLDRVTKCKYRFRWKSDSWYPKRRQSFNRMKCPPSLSVTYRLYKPKHLFFLLLTNQGLLSCVLHVFAYKTEVAAFGSVGGQTLNPRWARNIRIPSAVHALCTCCRVETSFVHQETHKRFTAGDRCSCNLSVPLHAMEYKSSCNHYGNVL